MEQKKDIPQKRVEPKQIILYKNLKRKIGYRRNKSPENRKNEVGVALNKSTLVKEAEVLLFFFYFGVGNFYILW